MSPRGQHVRNFITVKEAVKLFKFYHLLLMLICSAFYGMYMTAAYKILGQEYEIDDLTLTTAGSIGAVFNGGAKVIAGVLADKVGFKIIYYVVLGLQIVLAFSIYFIVKLNKILYVVWIALTQASLGAHFTIFPFVTAKIFGIQSGGLLYSLIFNGFTIGSLAGFIIQTYLLASIGQELFLFFAGFLSIVSLVMLYFLNVDPIIQEKYEDIDVPQEDKTIE